MIPVTVAVLTRNSAATLERALKSAERFAEIIICDGGSIDGTLDIARHFGARVIAQDARFLDAQGRTADFAGVRNQTLDAATYPWFLFLDSDEYLSPELVDEVGVKVSDSPAAYWVPRKTVWNGTIIECSVVYPAQQMRFFHRAVATTFIKTVHERIQLKDGIEPRRLSGCMYVPLTDTVAQRKAKWRYYLALEREQRTKMPLLMGRQLRAAAHQFAVGGLFLVRAVRIRLFCRGTKLPIPHDLVWVWYQWRVAGDMLVDIIKRSRVIF
ncbi:MAG TPA: glycosyltransferase family 2 protein [Candidatus Paceibacterota bacterium]